MTQIYFIRAGRAGRDDLLVRTPELAPLKAKTVSLFGLGCIGAPIALELARAGVGALRILDYDYVDPATIGRWPFGLTAAGSLKAPFIKSFLDANYPTTQVSFFLHRIGGIDFHDHPDVPSDLTVLAEMTKNTSLILDATAEVGVQQFLADYARDVGVPYVGVAGSNGGWGGKIFRFVPGKTEGCWLCYRESVTDGTIPLPPFRQDDEVQPVGCGDPTFTGAGFDMLEVSLNAVRIAVATLCAGNEGAYPEAGWDVTMLSFRDSDGRLVPTRATGYPLKKHPKCPLCSRK